MTYYFVYMPDSGRLYISYDYDKYCGVNFSSELPRISTEKKATRQASIFWPGAEVTVIERTQPHISSFTL